MRFAIVTALTALLLAAPVLAAGDMPTVYRWPAAPSEMPETPGSVALIVQVRGSVSWETIDGVIVIPPEAVCGPVLRPEAPLT